jgi:hypothetical protein
VVSINVEVADSKEKTDLRCGGGCGVGIVEEVFEGAMIANSNHGGSAVIFCLQHAIIDEWGDDAWIRCL